MSKNQNMIGQSISSSISCIGKQQQTSSILIVVGMINGMIGGVILVLPLLVIQAGQISSGLIIIVSGIFSYYSCVLCIKHLSKYKDLDQAIISHFNNKISIYIKIFYDFIVFLNLFLLLILYFELIVQQWQGMFKNTIINPISNFCILIGLVIVMKYYQFGVSLLAYGIVSTIGYCIFLIWMFISAPDGDQKIHKFGEGSDVIKLAAAMGQAFSIQTFFIPVLRKNNSQNNYQLYTTIAYSFGFAIYMYIGYAGSYGILHRQPLQQNPQTIQDYFPKGYWQLYCLQIIYLVHLYSQQKINEYIQYKNIIKKQIKIQQIVYTIIVIGICLIASLTNIQIHDIIQLNGAVVGFFFIYFLPLLMHIQCIYMPIIKNKIKNNTNKQIQIIKIVSSEDSMRTSLITQKSSQSNQNNKQNISKNQKQQAPKIYEQKQNGCTAAKPTTFYAIFDIIMLVGMMSTGIFVMFSGLYSVFS